MLNVILGPYCPWFVCVDCEIIYIYRVLRILCIVRSVPRLINNVCILLDIYYLYMHLSWINRVCTIDIAAIEIIQSTIFDN